MDIGKALTAVAVGIGTYVGIAIVGFVVGRFLDKETGAFITGVGVLLAIAATIYHYYNNKRLV